MSSNHGRYAPHIRVGIGGWNFAEWLSGVFTRRPARRERVEFASRALGNIEIQRHLLRHANARHLRALARRDARWLQFAVEASATPPSARP